MKKRTEALRVCLCSYALDEMRVWQCPVASVHLWQETVLGQGCPKQKQVQSDTRRTIVLVKQIGTGYFQLVAETISLMPVCVTSQNEDTSHHPISLSLSTDLTIRLPLAHRTSCACDTLPQHDAKSTTLHDCLRCQQQHDVLPDVSNNHVVCSSHCRKAHRPAYTLLLDHVERANDLRNPSAVMLGCMLPSAYGAARCLGMLLPKLSVRQHASLFCRWAMFSCGPAELSALKRLRRSATHGPAKTAHFATTPELLRRPSSDAATTWNMNAVVRLPTPTSVLHWEAMHNQKALLYACWQQLQNDESGPSQ